MDQDRSASCADRHGVGGLQRFRHSMPPGSYLLELVVADRLAKTKARATQTVDFEIVE